MHFQNLHLKQMIKITDSGFVKHKGIFLNLSGEYIMYFIG